MNGINTTNSPHRAFFFIDPKSRYARSIIAQNVKITETTVTQTKVSLIKLLTLALCKTFGYIKYGIRVILAVIV